MEVLREKQTRSSPEDGHTHTHGGDARARLFPARKPMNGQKTTSQMPSQGLDRLQCEAAAQFVVCERQSCTPSRRDQMLRWMSRYYSLMMKMGIKINSTSLFKSAVVGGGVDVCDLNQQVLLCIYDFFSTLCFDLRLS